MIHKKIKCVIFDFGKVISLPQNETYLLKMHEFLKLGRRSQQFEKIYYDLRMDYDGGQFTGIEFFQKIAAHFGLECSSETLQSLVESDILSWVDLNPGTLSVIESLKSNGFTLALLSNMPHEIMSYLKQKAEWLNLFDYTIFSCEPKICKPRPEIYHYCLEKIGVSAEECVFIDDNPDNINAAKLLGIHAVQFINVKMLKQTLQGLLY